MDALNSAIVLLNHEGRLFCGLAGRTLVQSSILIGLLLLADLCLRARVCARFRYAMWLLVLVKLVLPPSLALPTGAGYWLGRYLPTAPAVSAVSPPAAPTFSLTLPAYVPSLPGVGPTPVSAAEMAVVGRVIVPVQWPGLLLLGWVAGVLLLMALVLRRIASVRKALHQSHPARQQMIDLLEECRAELGIATPVTLRLTDDIRSPAVCGFARPVILLPTVLPPGLWPEGVRMILTHELAHIKRYDPWVSLAQTILQVVYFWHPLVWVANARLRHLRELAVDETVVVTLRSQAQCYTNTLIDIAEMAFRKPAFSLRLIGIAESKRALERRIKHMLNRHLMRRPTLGPAGLLTILAIGAVLIPMGPGSMTAQARQAQVPSVPALPAGIAELFGLSKDSILEKFGEPNNIFYGDQAYTLANLPENYFMIYRDVSFGVSEGTVTGITLLTPSHVFGNGVGVGDSEEQVKQAFGPDYELDEGGEFKEFLIYEALGLSFEIKKQDRSVVEINISPDYGDPARLKAYAHTAEFNAQLPAKVAQLVIDSAGLEQILATFGPPVKYIWGPKTLSADALPNRFIAVYPGGFRVFMMDNHIVELRFENNSTYAFAGKLRIGSTLEEALAVLGAPVETVEGKSINWSAKNVLFKDIGGQRGYCYYHRPDQSVRLWFSKYKIAAIYMTRSDYGEEDAATPSDLAFAQRLQERVDALDIDSAGPEQVKAIFGEPSAYVWGDQTFQPDALPDRYIMSYPCGFCVFMMGDRIMEIRHERHRGGSPYVYRGTLRLGSTMEEAVALLGEPTETVTGQKNEFKDGVLYRDANGDEGSGYYHRSDQKVRLFFGGGKVIAIYMTRSDYPAH